MDWKSFDPLKSFLPKINPAENNMVPGIDEYIQKVLSQYLGSAGIGQPAGGNTDEAENPEQPSRPVAEESPPVPAEEVIQQEPKPKLIDIHGFIIIQIEIPSYIDVNHLNVDYDSTRVVITGLYPDDEPLEIRLPYLVRRKAGKAIFKKNILEIRLIKQEDEHMVQLPIRRK
ncbi:hypothetical protein MM300_13920 [Evansella sp. LMS18]|jgi:HSP20 family molecular chaperone IbpA|uniref:hypothetical protein n=1 Tax=Evansella sp. LMS18 TaxID=2924033 RepID=UPI0020CFEF57|nr:hypothetical protein [Evansella sp. LMS18]UTR09020.1 hypothetical protein MM300_13920 [Evansella sp. LMS18]